MFQYVSRAALSVCALAFPMDLAAQETRALPEGAEPAAASADQLDWLVGDWAGPGVRGSLAMESWTAPVGGTMVGTFIQTNEDGTIRFTEHMFIRPVGESLEIAIKHFNPDLTSWEEKDEAERYQLVAIEPCAAFFDTFTIRCQDKEAPENGIVIAVAVGGSDDGTVRELVFRYGPAGEKEAVTKAPCPHAETTLEINICYANILAKAELRRREYAYSAGLRYADRPEVVTKIEASEEAFDAYRDAACEAVYEDWKEGTIRNVMSLTCRIDLTDQRTKAIWQNWLTFMDGTPSPVPEPQSSLR